MNEADHYRWWRALCIEWLAHLESVADADTDAAELQAIRDAVAQLTDPTEDRP